jgi:broad specificity phosphatase PhoE
VDREKRKIYLVRHAESVWNDERRVQGTCPGITLSERGRIQARLLGNRLRSMRIRSVYCSDAERAVETARIALGDGRDMILMHDLRELSLGEWEGRLICDLRENDPDLLDRWYRQPTTVQVEGAENMFSFKKRVLEAFDTIIQAPGGGDAIVISHGGVICAYLTHLLNMDLDDLWTFSLPNASLTTIILDFKPRLRAFGDTAHLHRDCLGADGMPSAL